MRLLLVLLLLPLSGCLGSDPAPAMQSDEDCPTTTTSLWFGPDWALLPTLPTDGSVFSNGFDEAFLVDEMDEWWSAPFDEDRRITGNLSLEFWVRNDGTPAPITIGGSPGDAYHWFNQVGSQRGFVADYGREYADVAPMPNSIDHYNETIAMPPGGLHMESGDRIRVLLTSLVADSGQGQGQHILFGESHPSRVTFQSTCWEAPFWHEIATQRTPISIAAHQGLITGQIPATDTINYDLVPFTIHSDTRRLTIEMSQTGNPSPLKDDMDITILDAQGEPVTGIGSPYSNERGTFYGANLAAMMPPGDYIVRVDSYSGHGYEGQIFIGQDA